ncbi:PAS domain S-box protein [Chloroflexales bacterium ZM16-3]|nr:PAS domain S-box protein [Chloroflexales bacterium ZM16-3]
MDIHRPPSSPTPPPSIRQGIAFGLRSTWQAYVLAAIVTAATLALYGALGFGADQNIFGLFLLPIILSAYVGGLGPGLFAVVLVALLTNYLLLPPYDTFAISSTIDSSRWLIMIIVGVLCSALSEGLHQARRSTEVSRQLYAVTLASIGDAVISTDTQGRVNFLNDEARVLTGWGNDALGQHLDVVFPIVNEDTRASVESPVSKVLRTGAVIGLANHTLLIARDGREIPIDDSGAPIKDSQGHTLGVVLVFRDVTEQRRAEVALQRSERTLKLFVEMAPAAIAMFDTEMRYLAVSRRFISDYRLEEHELIGRSHYEIFPEIPDRWREIHRRCQTGSVEMCEEDPFPREDGTMDWVRWELHPWYASEATIGGIVLLSEVITARKQSQAALRESEARFHKTLDTMLEGCQIIGFDWRYLYLNDSALRHARMSQEGLIGHTMMEVFPGIEQTEMFGLLHRCLEDRSNHRMENLFAYPDGSSAWYDLSIQPSPEGLFILSIDITDRKQTEAAIQAERALLAERVAERTAELRQVNTDLARATQLKDEFLANMSHELRTPLTAILGRTELMQEMVYGSITPKQADSLRGIEASGRHLLSLINDILDLSKIEAGKIEIEPLMIQVEPLCHSSLQMVMESARAKEISVRTTYDSMVSLIHADERRIKQILVNLLTNAVKFTPAGGSVGLEVRGNAQTDTVSFTVWDTGIGIAADDIAQLFQPFVQIDKGLNRQYEGTGLGLSLVQRLTIAHGGWVDVESSLGEGSRFRVTLPWNPEDVAPQDEASGIIEPARVPAASVVGLHILLAEDNQANSQVVEEYLRAHGYVVTLAYNGAEALACAEASPPAIILMDIQMPGMDGLEAIRRVRANERLATVPIIALTALAMPGDRERCLAAGADDYLAKPFSLIKLRELIAQHLRQR